MIRNGSDRTDDIPQTSNSLEKLNMLETHNLFCLFSDPSVQRYIRYLTPFYPMLKTNDGVLSTRVVITIRTLTGCYRCQIVFKKAVLRVCTTIFVTHLEHKFQ